MKQKRLPFDSESDLEQLLLRAGRASAPRGAKKRALLAASGAAAASTLAAAEGAAAATKLGSSMVAVKWIGVLCLTGVGAVAGAAGLRSAYELPRTGTTLAAPTAARPASKTAPQTRVDSTRVSPPALLAEPTPTDPEVPIAPATPIAPSPETVGTTDEVRPPPPSVDRTKPLASLIRIELSTLDDARVAIEAGNPARALSLLDGYRARFPRGEMAPEATLLRIEALCRAGRHDAAERTARSFLAGDSASPYAKRVQSLLSMTNP